jgi:cytochrome c-type biogenesis protein CcmF
VSWVFLTLGIILGARWAYVELGWGGYWAWDPVENASLLPWLIGTALLHSIMAQQHRGQLKIWNAGLITASFLLCIFGTYVVRSGVVASVHSFAESPIGWFFLFFIGVTALVSLGIILWRLPLLWTERPLEALTSKEGAFVLTNILLVAITAVTFIGTMYPVFSRPFGDPKSVDESFYNAKVMPMAIVLVAMMAIAPLLGYGREAAAKLMKRLAVPLAVGIFLVLVVSLTGLFNAERTSWTIWAVLSAMVVVVGVICIGWDMVRGIIERMKTKGENVVVALLRLLDTNHRRYGGQAVHVGMLMAVVGVAGSSLFHAEKELSMFAGETVEIGRYEMTFNGYKNTEGPNYYGMAATVSLKDTKTGQVNILHPEKRKYDKWDQVMSEVAIQSSWRKDLYVIFAGHDEKTHATAIRAMINPLVSWIWLGCWVMTAGGLVCMLPRLEPRSWRSAEVEPEPVKAKAPAKRRREPVGV